MASKCDGIINSVNTEFLTDDDVVGVVEIRDKVKEQGQPEQQLLTVPLALKLKRGNRNEPANINSKSIIRRKLKPKDHENLLRPVSLPVSPVIQSCPRSDLVFSSISNSPSSNVHSNFSSFIWSTDSQFSSSRMSTSPVHSCEDFSLLKKALLKASGPMQCFCSKRSFSMPSGDAEAILPKVTLSDFSGSETPTSPLDGETVTWTLFDSRPGSRRPSCYEISTDLRDGLNMAYLDKVISYST